MQRAKPDDHRKALDTLTRLLALRDHSRRELELKLARRFEEAVVMRVLNEAEKHGWLLSEERTAESATRSLQRKHKSARYIQAHLRKRGLPTPTKDLAAELESARALVERRFGDGRLSLEEKAKAQRFLQYRGFDLQIIRQVLK